MSVLTSIHNQTKIWHLKSKKKQHKKSQMENKERNGYIMYFYVYDNMWYIFVFFV